MSFLDPDVPWDSPVVETIPLPPFRSAEEHRRYVRMLQLHLAMLDPGAPALATVALSVALDPRTTRSPETTDWLTPLELSASLTTWFPAPWTPAALAATLVRDDRDAPTGGPDTWRWLNDPDFAATRGPHGGWSVTRHERGAVETGRLDSDRDLVVLWLDHFRHAFGFPLGHRVEGADVAALAPATHAVRQADEKNAAFPYRASWRASRDAALHAITPGAEDGVPDD